MSYPNIPDVTPKIQISKEEATNLLLASIAFEELGLAHIINSEAEKIQYVLGTLEGHSFQSHPTLNDLIAIDHTVEQVLRTVIKKQMLLEFKLEDTLTLCKTDCAEDCEK